MYKDALMIKEYILVICVNFILHFSGQLMELTMMDLNQSQGQNDHVVNFLGMMNLGIFIILCLLIFIFIL